MKISIRRSPHWVHTITLLFVIGCVFLSKQQVNCERKSLSSSTGSSKSEQKAQAKIAPEPVKISSQNSNVAATGGDGSEAASSEQQIAEKKQGDSATQAASAVSDLLNQESEYVQIKAEEIGAGSLLGKSEQSGSPSSAAEGSSASSSQSGGSSNEEQKSSAVDDELNAHLASNQQDSISQQESIYQPFAELAPVSSSYRTNGVAPKTDYAMPAGQGVEGRSLMGKSPSHIRPPIPSYTTMKGKLTGINPIVGQYPHPAPGYPHQMARHLPRGAAAGYAAFRDFVRAHASKYKQPLQSSGGSFASGSIRPYSPVARPTMISGGSYLPAGPRPVPAGRYNNKLSTAQAYIPHLNAGGMQQQHPASAAYSSDYSNSMLNGKNAMLTGGRPEYSKDFGMVIHYPQATVYTEPMSVDKLHKLTGAGISQVLSQLQYQIANGQRDESNTIRTNGRHHLGHGLSLHAKEYYAPGKGGRYVPTTAAVISSMNAGSSYPSSAPASAAYPSAALVDSSSPNEYSQSTGGPTAPLGSGYELVKQAVAKSQSQDKYNSNNNIPQSATGNTAGYPTGKGGTGYAAGSSGSASSLIAMNEMVGSELDSLYRANAALNKHIEQPEIQAQIQAYARQAFNKGPLKYRDLYSVNQMHQARPATSHPRQRGRDLRGSAYPRPQLPRSNRYAGMRQQSAAGQGAGNRYLAQVQDNSLMGPNRPYADRQPRGPASGAYRGNHHQQQQQQQMSSAAYLAAEQAMNEKMMQLLQEFQTGDEQYNGKPSSTRTVNQGYPQKVMLQKYQQQQQYPQQSAYNQHEGLEIPAGQNDQIGEIADLIEALKSSLEGHRPDPQQVEYAPKQAARLTEDVRYLAGALAQIPTYAMQVPVTAQQQQPEQQPQLALTYKQQAQGQQQQVASYQPALPAASIPAASLEQKSTGEQAYSSTGYQQQQQQQDQRQLSQSDYVNAAQQQPVLGNQVVEGTYPVSEGQPGAAMVSTSSQQYQPALQQYTSNEHSQIINHLVPVASTHEQSSTSGHLNQIGLTSPTESQYQQAQPLSSFVDSLPNDYQELLRQPPTDQLLSQTFTTSQQQPAQQYYANRVTYQNASTSAPGSSYSQQSSAEQAIDSLANSSQQQAQYSASGVKK